MHATKSVKVKSSNLAIIDSNFSCFIYLKKHMCCNMLHTDKNSQEDLRYNSGYIDPDCYDKSGSRLL